MSESPEEILPRKGLPPFAQAPIIAGVLLLITLWAFRLEKVLVLRADLGASGWARALLTEAAFVIAMECPFLLLLPRRRGLLDRVWICAVFAVNVLAFFLAVTEHQFFLFTGGQLRLRVALYAIEQLGNVGGVVGSAFNEEFVIRASLAVLCLVLAALLSRKRLVSFRFRFPRRTALVAVCGCVVFLAALPDPTERRTPFTSASFLDLVTPEEALAVSDQQLQSLYSPPRLLERRSEYRPNIVLIVLESTRADYVAPYATGDLAGNTPALAAFAAGATTFADAYVTIPHTSKALVGILCGMYARMQMPIVEADRSGIPMNCLPRLLDGLGYRTAFIQSAHSAFERRAGLLNNIGYQRWKTGEQLDFRTYKKVGYFGLDDFAMLEPAIQWMKAGGPEPFFLTLLTVNAHHPYEMPGVPLDESVPDAERYSKALKHVDSFLGKLLKGIDQISDPANTMIIVVGDHGEGFAEHGRRQHDVVPYEEGVRVPLIIRPPAWVQAPRTVSGLRTHLDIVPSILEVVGVSWEGTLPGRSLFSSPGHESVVYSCWYTNQCMGMRRGSTKVIYHYGLKEPEIYDLATDPGERNDLSRQVPESAMKALLDEILSVRFSVDRYYAGSST